MKKLLFLLFISPLFLMGCGSETVDDKTQNSAERSFGVPPEQERIIESKPKSNFSIIGEDVYFKGEKISGAFADSFEELGLNYAKDSNFAYRCGVRINEEPKFFDWETLEFPEEWNGYGKDKNALYYRSSECVDPKILEIIYSDEEKGFSYGLVNDWQSLSKKTSSYKYNDSGWYIWKGFTLNIYNEYKAITYKTQWYQPSEGNENKGGKYEYTQYFYNFPPEKVKELTKKRPMGSNDEYGEYVAYVIFAGGEKLEALNNMIKGFNGYEYLGSGYMKTGSTIYRYGNSVWKPKPNYMTYVFREEIINFFPTQEELDTFKVLKDGMAQNINTLWENGKVVKKFDEGEK